jgi:tRNA threonylcarbamoyladenosine biosynthesis protein TsaE
MQIQILSKNPKQTLELGKRLAKHLRAQDIICLFGPLGSGKTVLTKGIAEGLGLKNNVVSSPTFTFLNIYKGKTDFYHFDLYRVEKAEDLKDLGIDEFLYGQGVCVVEWAEKLESLLPEDCLEIKISHKDETSRQFNIVAKGKRAKELLKDISV